MQFTCLVNRNGDSFAGYYLIGSDLTQYCCRTPGVPANGLTQCDYLNCNSTSSATTGFINVAGTGTCYTG